MICYPVIRVSVSAKRAPHLWYTWGLVLSSRCISPYFSYCTLSDLRDQLIRRNQLPTTYESKAMRHNNESSFTIVCFLFYPSSIGVHFVRSSHLHCKYSTFVGSQITNLPSDQICWYRCVCVFDYFSNQNFPNSLSVRMIGVTVSNGPLWFRN